MGHHHHHDDLADAYDQVQKAPREAKLSHEVIAAAASYEAMKAYNDHCERNGKPASHEKAKEILAAGAGFFLDRMIETKGMDYMDKQKASKHAEDSAYDRIRY